VGTAAVAAWSVHEIATNTTTSTPIVPQTSSTTSLPAAAPQSSSTSSPIAASQSSSTSSPPDSGVPDLTTMSAVKNRLSPISGAEGAHTTWKTDPQTGAITRHQTWTANTRNPTGFDSKQSTDLTGKAHVNSLTGQPEPTPHTQGKDIPGGVRPATPDEIPLNQPQL
jgi:hypothetical protein